MLGIAILGIASAAFAPASAADFQLRLNGLDAFNQRVIPLLVRDAGLDHATPPDAELASGHEAGYDYRLTLRGIVVHVPETGLAAAFEPGDAIRISAALPDASLAAELAVDLVSPHWYEPDFHEKFALKGTGVSGAGQVGLRLSGGGLAVSNADFSGFSVDRVDVDHPGILGKLIDLVLAHIPLCGSGCHGVDDFATRVTHSKLRAFLESPAFVSPLESKLDAYLGGIARAELDFSDVGLKSTLALTELATDGGRARLGFSVAISPLPALEAETGPCGADVLPPVETAAPEFDFPDAATGDLEAALSNAVAGRVLFQLARAGHLCADGDGKLLGSPFNATARPVGFLTARALPDHDAYDLAVSTEVALASAPHAVLALGSRGIFARLHLQLAIADQPGQGLSLALGGVQVTDVGGKILVLGLPFRASRLHARLEELARARLEQSIATIPLLHESEPIGGLFRLRILPGAAVTDTHLHAAFSL